MATIRDIAKKAGVSVGTASRAITGNGYVSEETRAHILAIAEDLGYKPKEHIRPAGTSRTVGIVIPDITFPFYGAFLKYAEVVLAQKGYKTVVCNALGVQDRVGEMITMLEKRELDGIILNADVTGEEIVRLEKLPVVCLERLLGDKIPMVSSDHRQGGQLAAAEFLRCGCKNVLMLTAKHSNQLFGDIRITECQRILQEQNVSVTVAEIPGAMLSYKFLKDLTAEYTRLYSSADGVFTDDIMAYCYLEETRQLGIRVPEQLAIVGYDGNDIIRISSPRITTVEQNVPLLARTCVETLLRRIAGESAERQTLIPVSFYRSGTT